MKTYDEMTSSVLQRATAGIAERNRRRKTILAIAASGLCLALVLVAVGAFWKAPAGTDNTNPTISMKNPTTAPTQPEATEAVAPPTELKVYFLSSNAKQVSQQFLMEGVAIPIGGEIRVRRFGGLTEEERAQAIREEEAVNEAYRVENSTDYANVHSSVCKGETAMVSCLVRGSISLEFADKNHVSSVELENDWGNGIAGASVCYTKETTYGEGENQITFPVGSMRYLVFWSISSELKQKLVNDPYMSFSDISDTITITVNYSNGARQTLIVDVTVDDDGQVYMTQRGNNTGV